MCGSFICTSDQECQASCPPVMGGGTNCCDQGSGVCYATQNPTCPVPADACPSGGPICSPDDAGNTPPNPNTGSTGCDDCIECSCASSWCSCVADSSVDASGNATGCLGYTNCIVTCLNGNPDAGVPPADGGVQQCVQLCGPSYTQQQVQEGDALLSCLASSCTSPTACGG
jgi:hypothetical protein